MYGDRRVVGDGAGGHERQQVGLQSLERRVPGRARPDRRSRRHHAGRRHRRRRGGGRRLRGPPDRRRRAVAPRLGGRGPLLRGLLHGGWRGRRFEGGESEDNRSTRRRAGGVVVQVLHHRLFVVVVIVLVDVGENGRQPLRHSTTLTATIDSPVSETRKSTKLID